jgi:hypothetical protein
MILPVLWRLLYQGLSVINETAYEEAVSEGPEYGFFTWDPGTPHLAQGRSLDRKTPVFVAWNRIGTSVPQIRPEAGLPARQIKHLAEGAKPLKPVCGTELMHFVPYDWLMPASNRRTSARGFPFRRSLILNAPIGSKRRAGR